VCSISQLQFKLRDFAFPEFPVVDLRMRNGKLFSAQLFVAVANDVQIERAGSPALTSLAPQCALDGVQLDK
jgi:hypothetical protein